MHTTRHVPSFVLALAAAGALAAAPALAANALTPGTLTIDEPTLHALGFRWLVTGDDDKDARAAVSYRPSGSSTWQDGPAMLRVNAEPAGRDGWVCGNLFAGSVLGLAPGTSYDVRVTFSDPDGVAGTSVQTFTTATRPVPPTIIGTRTLHVYTSCSGSGRLQPCYTDIGTAGRAAAPGEIVLIHDGIYSPSLIDLSALASKPTTEAQPITFRGESRTGTILDGHVTPARGAGQEIFSVIGTKYLTFENFTIRNAGNGFYGRDAVGLVIRRMRMLNVGNGIGGATSPKGKDRRWTISDNEIVGWNTQWYPYATQSVSIAGVGIRVYGKGHAVEHNTVGKFWDCIAHSDTGGGQVQNATVDWANPPSVNIDFENNELYECFDDALSADYGFHNLRIVGNRMTNAHTALSVQPLYGGPVYLVRNAGYNMAANSFKFHNQPAGIEAYHNTIATHDFAWECDAGWLNARIHNNLLLGNPGTSSYSVASGTVPHPQTTMDHNGYTPTRGSNLVSWNRAPYLSSDVRRYRDFAAFAAGEGFDAHGVLVDYPALVDALYPAGEGTTYPVDDADLALRNASIAIDAGARIAGINASFAGAAPDLGAYEFGAPRPVYGVRPDGLPPGEAGSPPPGAPGLRIAREGAGYRLNWTAPEDGGAVVDYVLYASPLAARAFDPSCAGTLGSGLTAYVPSLAANSGFVVVARNASGEGSYGATSATAERPRATGADACP